jgi:RNA binding exosome subunit
MEYDTPEKSLYFVVRFDKQNAIADLLKVYSKMNNLIGVI